MSTTTKTNTKTNTKKTTSKKEYKETKYDKLGWGESLDYSKRVEEDQSTEPKSTAFIKPEEYCASRLIVPAGKAEGKGEKASITCDPIKYQYRDDAEATELKITIDGRCDEGMFIPQNVGEPGENGTKINWYSLLLHVPFPILMDDGTYTVSDNTSYLHYIFQDLRRKGCEACLPVATGKLDVNNAEARPFAYGLQDDDSEDDTRCFFRLTAYDFADKKTGKSKEVRTYVRRLTRTQKNALVARDLDPITFNKVHGEEGEHKHSFDFTATVRAGRFCIYQGQGSGSRAETNVVYLRNSATMEPFIFEGGTEGMDGAIDVDYDPDSIVETIDMAKRNASKKMDFSKINNTLKTPPKAETYDGEIDQKVEGENNSDMDD